MADKPNTTNPSAESLDGRFATLDALIADVNAMSKMQQAISDAIDPYIAAELAKGLSPEDAREEGTRVFYDKFEARLRAASR